MAKYLTRKAFMISHGATCTNWTWSWSFVNQARRHVIFGAWSTAIEGDRAIILDKAWAVQENGRKANAYSECLEHLRLVADEKYSLSTFTLYMAPKPAGSKPGLPVKIQSFDRELTPRTLERVGDRWYAVLASAMLIPEEVDSSARYTEGAVSQITVNAYERNKQAREACIAHYGAICHACKFNFEVTYGEQGKGFIHVHHLKPLSSIKESYQLDPVEDLRPLCANCHAIIHRPKEMLTIEQLQQFMADAKSLQMK